MCFTALLRRPCVAPRVGAWIETFASNVIVSRLESHPVWVRGLKLRWFRGTRFIRVSHPVWVRGLKLEWNFMVLARCCRTPCGCVD